jgi:hypothetical protein
MIIETWVAALITVCIAVMCIAVCVCLLAEQKGHRETRQELDWAREEIADLKRYISVQKAKNIVNVANDFYNEGKKK